MYTANHRGPVSCVRHIIKVGGLRSLFAGTTVTIIREIPAYGVYMAAYVLLRRLATPENRRDPVLALDLLAGGFAGTLSWVTTMPIDVVKTRIQSVDPSVVDR